MFTTKDCSIVTELYDTRVSYWITDRGGGGVFSFERKGPGQQPWRTPGHCLLYHFNNNITFNGASTTNIVGPGGFI